MHLTRDDLRALVCPTCHGAIRAGADLGNSPEIRNGYLDCEQCGRTWLVSDGIANMLDADGLRGSDVWLRPIYDVVAPWHDLGVTLALPWMQFPDFGGSRERYMTPLDLESLQPRVTGDPLRVLEVGIGSGGNLPLVTAHLRSDLDVEIWGLDYSRIMLLECRRRLPWYTTRPVRLVLGDAHKLPFGDATFDRVFHVGGINGYHDPRTALAEMARVARRGTPIVVVDEQLDPARVHLPQHYLWYRALTWLNTIDGPPIDQLPAGATDVDVRPVSRFYYCMKFRIPPRAERSGDGDALNPGTTPQDSVTTGSTEGGITMDPVKLTAIRGRYTEAAMNAVLTGGLVARYAETAGYAGALTATFATNLPAEGAANRQKLSAADRERVIVALLCGRGERGELAVHIYIALANLVEVDEIKHIMFLTAVYTGVPALPKGVKVLNDTIDVLVKQYDDSQANGDQTLIEPLKITLAIADKFEM